MRSVNEMCSWLINSLAQMSRMKLSGCSDACCTRIDFPASSGHELVSEMSCSYLIMTTFMCTFRLKHFFHSFFSFPACATVKHWLSSVGDKWLMMCFFFLLLLLLIVALLQKQTIFMPVSTISGAMQPGGATTTGRFLSRPPPLEWSTKAGKINYNCLPLASLINQHNYQRR